MITSIVIGFVLISVYFFFATRQLSRATAQTKAMTYNNQKNYLESYTNYLTDHPEYAPQNEIFHDITVKLINHTDEIVSDLDFGDSHVYKIDGDDKKIIIEWNKCPDNYKADLLLIDDTASNTLFHVLPPPPSICVMNTDDYDDKFTAIAINGSSFTISTLNAPFYYRITAVGKTYLYDNQWHLDAYVGLDYKQRISVNKTFIHP